MTTAEQDAIAAASAAAGDGMRPSAPRLWDALASVPDPEVPVVSVVELGIVRGLRWEGATLVVRVTPTYSGCPATELISDAIRSALEAIGVKTVRIDVELAPPWTTDWIAPEAKARLRDFGIAPPGPASAARVEVTGISPLRRAKETVSCPRCGSTATSLLAQFGSTACKALYRCEVCKEPFDYFKPH